MVKKTFRIGIEATGTKLIDLFESEAVYGFDTDEDITNSVVAHLRNEMDEEDIIDALNLEDASVVLIDEYDNSKTILE